MLILTERCYYAHDAAVLIILAALKKELPDLRTEIYGRELFRRLGGRLQTGTLYVILHRLEDEGWLLSRRDATDPNISPLKLYKWTQKGYDKVREAALAERIALHAGS